jgi:hypothetical protein
MVFRNNTSNRTINLYRSYTLIFSENFMLLELTFLLSGCLLLHIKKIIWLSSFFNTHCSSHICVCAHATNCSGIGIMRAVLIMWNMMMIYTLDYWVGANQLAGNHLGLPSLINKHMIAFQPFQKLQTISVITYLLEWDATVPPFQYLAFLFMLFYILCQRKVEFTSLNSHFLEHYYFSSCASTFEFDAYVLIRCT